MPANAQNILNIMQGVTNTAKHIIFIQIYFVIHYCSIKLTILSCFQSLSSAAVNVINFQYRKIVAAAI